MFTLFLLFAVLAVFCLITAGILALKWDTVNLARELSGKNSARRIERLRSSSSASSDVATTDIVALSSDASTTDLVESFQSMMSREATDGIHNVPVASPEEPSTPPTLSAPVSPVPAPSTPEPAPVSQPVSQPTLAPVSECLDLLAIAGKGGGGSSAFSEVESAISGSIGNDSKLLIRRELSNIL